MEFCPKLSEIAPELVACAELLLISTKLLMAAETIELLLLGHTTIFLSWHLLCHSSVLLLNGHLEWATHGLLLSSCRMILRSLIIGFSSLTGQYFSLATFC